MNKRLSTNQKESPMFRNLVLKDHIRAHLKASNESFANLAQKIQTSPSSLFNWSEGGAITLSEKNLQSLLLLSEEIEIDLPFLLFPIESAKRYHATQKFNETINPHLQHFWIGITKEIRLLIKSELQIKG